nr:aminotransferase class I/II-fold pyridoxal phosphate-dependent enzyme [uncultured Arsenicibacter sp.]
MMQPFTIPLSPPDISTLPCTSHSVDELYCLAQHFSQQLAAITGNTHCLLTNAGSSALQLALATLPVAAGDEVFCQSLTFAASANCIVHQGATPVFIGSESRSWNMCPDALETALRKRRKRPKAVIAVDLYGVPAQWHELQLLCRQFGVPLIEDAAEALGSTYHSRPCGSFGDISILSFNVNKIITTLGGGALLTNDEMIFRTARWLGSQAKEPVPHYEHERTGYNTAFNPVAAPLGLQQLSALTERVQCRRAHLLAYQQAFQAVQDIRFQPEPAGSAANRWLTACLFNEQQTGISRETVRLALARHGIEARPVFKPMHRQPVYKKSPFYGTGLTENIFDQGLCLPSGSTLNEVERQRVIDVVLSLFCR